MASKRTFHVGSTSSRHDKDLLDVPSTSSTKRIKHGNQEEQQKEIQHLLLSTTTSAANNTCALLPKVAMQEVMIPFPPMLHHHLNPSCRLTFNELANIYGRRRLQLCLVNQLPERIYTKSIIKAEGDEPLQIELRDAENQQRVVTDKSYSLKIQICVLHGDFGKEEWTAEEFDTQIVIPREGKGQLLKGNKVITLRNGVASIDKEITFTDISKRRTDQFRLGFKIDQSNSFGMCIREGRSEPFRVLDVRGKAYEKYDRPSLNGEVWRLKGIRKDGKLDKQLASHGIQTVQDFLQLYITNEASLKEKIGKNAGKSWNKIVEHAKDCDVDDDERYIYYATEQPILSLVFNSIYEVLEVTFHNEQNSRSIRSLSPQEKRLVDRVKQNAYKNLNDLKPLPIDTTIHGLVETSTSVQNAQYGGQDQALQQFDFPIAQQGQNEILPEYVEPFISTSYVNNEGMDDCQINVDPVPQKSHVEGEMYIEADNYGSHFPVVEGGYSIEDLINDCPIYTTCEPESNNLYGISDVAECSTHVNFLNSSIDVSNSDKSKAVWYKVRIAIKWVISVRKVAAAKRNANLFYFNYN